MCGFFHEHGENPVFKPNAFQMRILQNLGYIFFQFKCFHL